MPDVRDLVMKSYDFSGKTVVITGASRGIGAATATAFAQSGANVVLTARSQNDITAHAEALGDNALAVPCDVADADAVADMMTRSVAHFGQVDILINNAGMIEPISLLSETDPTDFSRAIDVNLKGVFHGIRAVLPHMLEKGAGTIINISSGAAHGPAYGWPTYCSSKAGVYMLTRAADLENRDKGIRVLGLSPGTVATEMQRVIKASGINRISALDWSDHIPPEWPAQALLWMCTPHADAHLGTDISLRDENIRHAVGLA